MDINKEKEWDEQVKKAYEGLLRAATEKLRKINDLSDEFLYSGSTPTNLVREVIQAVETIHKIKDVIDS